MYNQISNSGWQGILTQYSGPEGSAFKFVSSTLVVGHPYIDGGPEPSGVNQTKMAEEVEHAITVANELGYGWPTVEEAKTNINDQFVLFTTPAATYEPSVTYCGAHFYYYHYPSGYGYAYDSVRWNPSVCSLTITGAHEYAEAATDPYYNGWKDWSNTLEPGEIADICGSEERGFLPGGTEVPALWDNSSKGVFGTSEGSCVAKDSNPPQEPPETLTEAATELKPTEATLHGTIHEHMVKAASFYFEWGETKSYGHRSKITVTKNPQSATISGLLPGTVYHYRLVMEAWEGNSTVSGNDVEFKTPDHSPTVTTEGNEEVASKIYQVHAKINPHGFSTSYGFEYGKTKSYGSKVEAKTLLTGSGEEAVALEIEGLKGETAYHYRVFATNEGNGAKVTNHGEDKTFTTPSWKPVTTAEGATDVRLHRATLNGIVDPHGLDTTYHFEYINDAACQENIEAGEGYCFEGAASIPVTAEDIGSGTKDVAISRTLEGLQPWTSYDYRIVASNVEATVYGEGETFATNGKWTLESPPDPKAGNSSTLADVSCSSSSSCLAVGYDSYAGHTLGEFWNGTKWSLIGGEAGQYPGEVSCGSAASCWAVGSKLSDGSPLVQRWYEEAGEWEGYASTKIVTPTGASNLHLDGISCTAATECTAVGYYYKEGHNRALAEHLKGSTWTLQTTPEVSDAVLEDVSCTSTSACTAVGYRSGSGVHESLAEHWDGEKWSTIAVPAPEGKALELLRLNAVSCASATSCVATGSFIDEEFEEGLPFTVTYNGTKFSLAPTPKLKEGTRLADVSCTSSTACLAVGQSSGGSSTLALAWNGSEWSTQASLTPTGKTAWLTGVSCASPLACTTVGWDYGGGEWLTLAERFSASWTLESPPDPKAGNSSTLADVSCSSSSSCLAVGYDSYAGHTLGEFWNGTKWSLIGGEAGQYPGEVSCGSAASCWAVGSKLSDGSPLVQRWYEEAGEWEGYASTKIVTPTGASNLHLDGISCTAATECTAVGYYYKEGHNRALAEHLKGSTWTLQTTPEVSDAVLEDVSCTSTSACTAVGYRSGSGVHESLAEHWDGEKWSTIAVPAPEGKALELLRLNAVSCASATSCVATGSFIDEEFEEGLPFTVTYNGTKFSLAPTPKLKEGTRLADVSCTSSTACLAVGQSSGGSSTLALAWNGSEWSTQASLTPTGKTAWLTGVSCASPLACTTVGWDYGGGEWLTLAERWE